MKTTTAVEITPYTAPSAISRKFTFKNEALNHVSEEIAAIGGRLTAESAKLAILLANVDRMGKDKLAEDGFKSAAAYAFETFNIGKAAVSQLCKSARRFYMDEDGNTIKPENAESVATWYSPYTLCYLADFDSEALRIAVEGGELKPDMPQAEVKKWASAHKVEPEEPEIVKTYTVNVLAVLTPSLYAERNEYHNITMDGMLDLDEVRAVLHVLSSDEPEDEPEDGADCMKPLTDSPFKSSVEGWRGRLIVGASGYAIIHYMETPKPKRPRTTEEKEAAERRMLAKLLEKYKNG